jgi:transposase
LKFLADHLCELDVHLTDCDRDIAQHAHDDPRAQRLARLSGVGVLTASAVAHTVIDPQQFRCGRQFAAWIVATYERIGYHKTWWRSPTSTRG